MQSIRRYPVKGVGGESLASVILTASGIALDRALALPTGAVPLQRYGTWTTHAAFHTLISKAELARSTARVGSRGVPGQVDGDPGDDAAYVEIEHPERGVLHIPLSDDTPQLDRSSGAWEPLADDDVTPVHLGVPLWDVEEAHVSIINLASVQALSERFGVELDPARFRANLYLEGLPPWQEFDWLGRHLLMGDAEVAVFAPIERCRATSARPGGAEWDLNLPAALAGHFGHPFCGVYARVVRPGAMSVADEVTIAQEHGPVTNTSGLLLDPAAPRWGDVVEVSETADGVHSLMLSDPTAMLNGARAGQYLRVHGGPDQAHWRNYTISNRVDERVRITVRHEKHGRFSPWLTSRRAGDQLLLSGPYGVATLPDPSAPVVLATAGIGITPTVSLMKALAEQRHAAPVTVLHVARATDHIPHWDEICAAAEQLADCSLVLFLTRGIVGESHGVSAIPSNGGAADSQPTDRRLVDLRLGRPRLKDLEAAISGGADRVFICGPDSFVAQVRRAASNAGVAPTQVHADPFYSPPDPDQARSPAPSPGPFQVTWADGSQTTWVEADGTLLDHAESRGIPAPAACRSGVCGTCTARVRGGTAVVFAPFAEAKAPDERLLCSVVPTEDVCVGVGPEAASAAPSCDRAGL